MELAFLEKIVNQKIQGLDQKYDLSSAQRSELIKEVWVITLAQVEFLDEEKILWGGYTEDDNKVRFRYVSDTTEATKLHEKFNTDSNLYLGNIKHVKENNSFASTPTPHFFIDSWYGCISGEFNSLKVSENSFFARKSA